MFDKKKRDRFSALLAIALLLCVVGTAGAQTPSTFTYQGRLSAQGAPASGVYDFEFRLFDDASSGAQIGATIQRLNVAVTNGVFTVQLDFGADAFPGANRFLEIGVRPTGGGSFTQLAPRQPFTATPYAIRSVSAASADNADNAMTAQNSLQLGGVAADQYVQTKDPRLTDERPPAPGSANYIQNTTAPQTADFNISGSGLIGTNLGVGTATPRATLDVAGNAVQSLPANGFVKAMAFVTVTQDQMGNSFATFTRCYNSVLNSSTGGCGFSGQVSQISGGFRVRVNFGFVVDDRFVFFQDLDDPGNTALNTNVGRIAFFNSTTAQVITDTGRFFVYVF